MGSSAHFSHDELKCKCGCEQNEVKSELLDELEQLRIAYGKPMKVNSGYRCAEHNAAVGGHPNSSHMDGLAVDISIDNSVDRHDILSHALECGFDGIGIARNFIHFDKKKRHANVRVVFTY